VTEPARPLPPLEPAPRVSVIVPALDAADVVGRAVGSALAQQVVAEVVVAAGDDATRRAAARVVDERVVVIGNPSGRTPDALNIALQRSSGEVIVRLDAHAVLPPGYVEQAVAALRRTGAANVGGRQVPHAADGFAAGVAAAMSSPLGAGGAAYRRGGHAGPADTVYLGVFRREALDAVGAFDPRFTRNQDAELNERLRRAGFVVWFEPGLAVTYRPRSSVGALARQYFEYGRWRRLTARIHRGSLAPRQLLPPALVAGLVVVAGASAMLRRPVLLLGYLSAYLLAIVAGASATIRPPRVAPAAVVALAVMHVAWGAGFLVGPPGNHAATTHPPTGASPGR
jgi:succinoglycan biosynthesis protein ExoA